MSRVKLPNAAQATTGPGRLLCPAVHCRVGVIALRRLVTAPDKAQFVMALRRPMVTLMRIALTESH